MLVSPQFLQEAEQILTLDEQGQEKLLLAMGLETLHLQRQADDELARLDQECARDILGPIGTGEGICD